MGAGVLHLGKNVENRRWRTYFRGPILIHAGLVDRDDDALELNIDPLSLQADRFTRRSRSLPYRAKHRRGEM